MTNLDSIFKSRDMTLPTKVHVVKAILFSSGHVWMWELACEESWAPKNWCFWTVVLEKTLGSPLDYKEIQSVNSKGDQSWVFFGRTDAKAETPILWPPSARSWLIGKDSDAGRDWGQEEKGTTEDEMAGWHHRLDGRLFEWTPGDGDGQGGLACCSSWGRKESDMAERLNWTEDSLKVLSLLLLFTMNPYSQCQHVFYFSIAVQQTAGHVVVQLLNRVWLFMSPWTAAHQASLSFTISWSLFTLISTESVMPSNHLILCRPLLLLPSIFPSIRVFWSSLLNEIRLYSRTWTPGGKDLWGIPRGWLSQCLCWTGCWSQHCSKIQVRGACNRPHALEVPLLPSSSLICLQTAKGNRGDVHTENPPACLQTCFIYQFSSVTQSCPNLCDPWTVAHQAPLSMGFFRQEYWSGLPFPSPGVLN